MQLFNFAASKPKITAAPDVPVLGAQVGGGPLGNVVAEAVLRQVQLQGGAVSQGHVQALQAGDEVRRMVLALAVPRPHLPWQRIQNHTPAVPRTGQICGFISFLAPEVVCDVR